MSSPHWMKAPISLQSSIVLLSCNVSTPINQVQVLEQLLFLANENVQISPSSDFFTSVSDCLHIFRAFTSQKNASAWARPNYVRRRNDNNHAQMETRRCFESCSVVRLRRGRITSQWTPGYNTGKDPPTLIHDLDTLTVCQRYKNNSEMLFVVVWCLFVVMLCSFCSGFSISLW